MLERTNKIRNVEEAITWMQSQSKKLRSQKYIYIMHNFIHDFSSAFAYAEPGKRNVLIESAWGLPEILYYYSHDI